MTEEDQKEEVLECSECSASYPPSARFCPGCGVEVGIRCPQCGSLNSARAQTCQACVNPLDIVDPLLGRMAGGQHGWLANIQRDASNTKEEEEEASQVRLSAMWEIEDQRLKELAQAQAERDRQQSILVWGSLILAAVFIVSLLIVLAVAAARSPGPLAMYFL